MTMWYLLAIVGFVVVLFVAVRIVRTALHGTRLIKSIRSTDAAPGSVEASFVEWLRERRNRTQQKDMFMQLMMGLGMSEGWCADSVVRCIVHSWTPDGQPFGQLLVGEMEQHVTWDDPSGDPEKIEAQRRAKEMIWTLKSRLLALDSEPMAE